MADSPPSSLWDLFNSPVISGVIGGTVGILGTVSAALFKRGPSIQQQINEAFGNLIEGYESRIADLTTVVEGLRTEISELTDHVDKLNDKLQQAGIQPPQRQRRN